MKQCTKCHKEKELHNYYNSKKGNEGKTSKCKSCFKSDQEIYREKNYERLSKKAKYYYDKNKTKITLVQKEYTKKNKVKKLDYTREYRKNNREKINSYSRIARNENPIILLKNRLRARTYLAFKAGKWLKNSGNEEMLGCSYDFSKSYIESLFLKGMSWSNKGEWHIDHIIPLSTAKTVEEMKSLFHYTNLQPLWAKDNLKKSAKIIEKQLKLI